MNNKKVGPTAQGVMTISLVFVLILLVAGAFWYWALYVESSIKKVVTLSAGGTKAAQEQKVRSMRKELRDTQYGRSALRRLALTEALVPDFLNELESLGTTTVQVRILGVDVQSDAGFVSIALSFSGDFKEVVALVKKINGSQYASYVDTLEVRTGEDSEGGGSAQDVNMRLRVPLLVPQDKG